jgi:4-amino-4-deoxy-L-arabinose transferase-like glycosyltransferase
LAPDEAYYWVWSRALAPGYLDHPPMVALWIRAGTALAGEGALGVRLLAPISAGIGSLLLARAAEDLVPGRGAWFVAPLLLNATLLFGAGSVTMTPDTPLLFFWTATLWALARLLATGQGWWWLVAGACAGLALTSKFSALLLGPAILLWLLAVPRLRPWLRRPHPWVAGLIAVLMFAPVLVWNAGHGWASFVKQGGRAGDWNPSRALQFVAELLLGQIGLATPLVALLCGAGIWLAVRQTARRDAGFTLLATCTALPGLVFLQHALGDRVQANWPAIIYPAACIAAAGLTGRWARLVRPASVLGFGITGIVWLQAVAAPLRLPARLDPTLARLGGWPDFAARVEEFSAGADFVAADNYALASELARNLPGLPVVGVEDRWAFFDLPDAQKLITDRTGILVRSTRRGGEPDATDWDRIEPLGIVARERGGVVAEEYRLYRVTGRAGPTPAVELPRPR